MEGLDDLRIGDGGGGSGETVGVDWCEEPGGDGVTLEPDACELCLDESHPLGCKDMNNFQGSGI